MVSVEERIRKLNDEFGKIDDRLFEITEVHENFFGEYVVALRVTRMVKASYTVLRKIAELTGAKDILIERTQGDNLAEIKLLIPKK